MKPKYAKKDFAYEDEDGAYSDEQKQDKSPLKKPKSPLKKSATKNINLNITAAKREANNKIQNKTNKVQDQEVKNHNQMSNQQKKAAKMKQYISSMIDQPDKIKYDSLTNVQEWAYSVGHLMNDLTAACWFNYLLYWLKEVLQFEYASWSMLSGQIFDAITTPLVGYLSDNTNTRFGKRMPWYVIGTILVLIGFLPVFHCFIPGKIWSSLQDSEGARAFYYIFFPSLFNVGWAAVQISHMSLVPSLTVSRKRRDTLNNKRNTFTFIGNLLVLVCALILFQTVQDSLIDFELLGCIVVGIGIFTTIFFMVCINEQHLMKECDKHTQNIKSILAQVNVPIPERETQIIDRQNQQIISHNDHIVHTIVPQHHGHEHLHPSHDHDHDHDHDHNHDHHHAHAHAHAHAVEDEEQLKSWKDWLKEREFYHYAFVYMGCRLYCNIISTMINFYLVYVLKIASEDEISNSTPIEIALIPLLLFISSVLMSSVLDQLYQKIGKRKIFSIGSVLMILSSVCLALVEPETGYLMYAIAILIGCTQVLLLNTGITLISDVIGLKGKSGAFVFGSYSFMDKISTGIALFFISESQYFKSESFIRWVTVLVPLCSGLFAWFLVMTGSIPDIVISFSSESELSDSDDSNDINKKNKNRKSNSSSRNDFEEDENENESEKDKSFVALIESIKKEFAN